MWSEQYEKLSSYEKIEFRRLGNYLLSHTYMVRFTYDSDEETTLPNADFNMVMRLFEVLQEYFEVTGWRLSKDDDYGIVSLISEYDNNRFRLDRFTTLFLYVCRLIYEENRENENSYHVVKTDKVEPNKEYERYYKMITDEMLMGGYTLMMNQFNEKYREEISELFSVMTGEGNSALDQSEYEKRVRLFTDYRTYLTFDIEVTNKEGEKQRLSRTIDKKSGGETQTPFYIAVLASFAQLYRMGRDKKANTARLIIFDEAFSKMDGERIEKSILLLRKIGFQVILSTPTEKAGDIAPWVDRILLVLRSGKTSQVTVFDKERIGELIDE